MEKQRIFTTRQLQDGFASSPEHREMSSRSPELSKAYSEILLAYQDKAYIPKVPAEEKKP